MLAVFAACGLPALGLSIHADFPGGSAEVVSIDAASRIVRVKPATHRGRGWPCWWFFRVDGTQPGKTLTVEVKAMAFGLPERAAVSSDGRRWHQSSPGQGIKGGMVYQVIPAGGSIWMAWGPPYQGHHAQRLVQGLSESEAGPEGFILCRTREGRSVPALRFSSGSDPGQPMSVWIQARQHAWESGSSWVAEGLARWLASSDPQAKALRARAEVVVVPIMDLDNVERGAGGKDQKPHDHNRDWSDQPHWPAVRAAQAHLRRWDQEGRRIIFLDLHNPGPADLEPFYFMAPASELSDGSGLLHARFLDLARQIMGEGDLAFRGKVRSTGPAYHPRWRHISSVWVSRHLSRAGVSLCLETSWNTDASDAAGYQSVGKRLGETLAAFVLGGADQASE